MHYLWISAINYYIRNAVTDELITDANKGPTKCGKLGILLTERKLMLHTWHQIVPYLRKRKKVCAEDGAHSLQSSGWKGLKGISCDWQLCIWESPLTWTELYKATKKDWEKVRWFGCKSTRVLWLRNSLSGEGKWQGDALAGAVVWSPFQEGEKTKELERCLMSRKRLCAWRTEGMSRQHLSMPPPGGVTSQVLQTASRPAEVTQGAAGSSDLGSAVVFCGADRYRIIQTNWLLTI